MLAEAASANTTLKILCWSLFILQDTLGSLQSPGARGTRSKSGCCSAAPVPRKALEFRFPSHVTNTRSFPNTSPPTQRSGQPHEPHLATDGANLCSYLRESNLRGSSSCRLIHSPGSPHTFAPSPGFGPFPRSAGPVSAAPARGWRLLPQLDPIHKLQLPLLPPFSQQSALGETFRAPSFLIPS